MRGRSEVGTRTSSDSFRVGFASFRGPVLGFSSDDFREEGCRSLAVLTAPEEYPGASDFLAEVGASSACCSFQVVTGSSKDV